MDYEQKYKEALERLRNAFYNNNSRICEEYRNAALKIIEPIFPELAESEDERIRKALINGFDKLDKSAAWYNGITNGQILAWLEKQGEKPKKHDVCDNCDQQGSCVSPCPMKLVEKQGEQKPTQEIEPTPIFKIGDILKRKGKDYTFRVDRIQGGYYHCDRNHGAFFPIEEQGNWELVEQKPVWSEEDEEMLKIVIKSCEQCGNEYAYYWLKSIKDRVQPKQEWSEEDEKMLKDTIRFCELCGNQVSANWLKSLRPQNMWKPSEKQLNELHKVITNTGFNPYVIKSLYDNLKKLREE